MRLAEVPIFLRMGKELPQPHGNRACKARLWSQLQKPSFSLSFWPQNPPLAIDVGMSLVVVMGGGGSAMWQPVAYWATLPTGFGLCQYAICISFAHFVPSGLGPYGCLVSSCRNLSGLHILLGTPMALACLSTPLLGSPQSASCKGPISGVYGACTQAGSSMCEHN